MNFLIALILITTSTLHAAEPTVPFTYPRPNIKQLSGRQTARRLYEQLILNGFPSSQPRIPRIIHQIWLGSKQSELPERHHALRDSFKHFHPNWEYRLWTEKELQEFCLTNQELFDHSDNFGEKSDIARYEILYRIGGLYVDCDVQCLASFEQLHYLVDFYAGLSPLHHDAVAENCIIGCCPGNPLMLMCIKALQKRHHNEGYFKSIVHNTGPLHLTRCFFAYQEHTNDDEYRNVLLPHNYFFTPEIFGKAPITAMPLLALHYWEGSWQNQNDRWHQQSLSDYHQRWCNQID